MDEEIILEGLNLSPKSYVDEEIILEGPNLPLKTDVTEVVSTTSYAVFYSSAQIKVSQETSVKSNTNIQALP